MFKWLSYGNDASAPPNTPFANVMDKQFFNQREWSFTIEDDIYIRYQNFKDKQEMIDAIKKRQPHKIDIGAVFSAPPKDHTTIRPERFYPVERELVFDIDMTDYDPVRTCCTGANICKRCWPFMTMALKCMDKALREDFAYKHILWIYSGRRGVHCWVNDKEARGLTNEARSAVVEYLSLEVEGKETKLLRQVQSPLHPHLKRSYDILEPYFEKAICDDDGQGLLAGKNYIHILNTIPDEMDGFMRDLNAAIQDPALGGAERWRIMKELMSPTGTQLGGKKRARIDYKKLEQWKYALVFKYTYPRLDANVSKSMNHLLKSPFCVHPKTGRVCIPMDPAAADDFDPITVPTVRTLCDEIDSYDRKNPDDANITTDTEKTAMKNAIEVFERTYMGPMMKDINAEFRDKQDQKDAVNVDF